MALPRRDPGAAEFEHVVGVGELAREAAPADALARLQHRDGEAAPRQRFCRRRAGEAGADDEDVGVASHPRAFPLPSWSDFVDQWVHKYHSCSRGEMALANFASSAALASA